MRILLDSNIWLAIVTCDGVSRALWRRIRDRVTVVAADVLYAEIRDKLVRKFNFSPAHAAMMTGYVRLRSRSVGNPRLENPACRDPDDDRVLAAATAGHCEYLITRDNDLLALVEYRGVRIMRLREFSGILDRGSS
ncbi:MAG: putative toxin-antitoxin system toxin component, PIN family [Verrucomicrobia bacterium]|nr:putative toxin-antitoxin system toxin component, PIN family [Verrucomicrobiota bacterium]